MTTSMLQVTSRRPTTTAIRLQLHGCTEAKGRGARTTTAIRSQNINPIPLPGWASAMVIQD
jgi:hypothetical protein